jgi:hypothetical protein
MHKFIVQGGVFTDTTFTALVPGTVETYGPFDSYIDAEKSWWSGTCKKVDICTHKLNITHVNENDQGMK